MYVLLLRLQLHGADDRSEPLAQTLLSGALAQRNDAAIRYRMRNISAVVQELGAPILNDFSPAESVGRLVRPKIKAMLLEDTDFARILKPGVNGGAKTGHWAAQNQATGAAASGERREGVAR
ncbi:hypothetical protein, partial [Aminobacter sp. BE322]|uniref:hypothetical protein n=1 Tax=unclassified Aminobacter TaxID=2644704 RepID=UPI003D1C2ACF